MSTTDVAVIQGVGPGLGAALARRFARGGLAVGLFARSAESTAATKEAIERDGGRAMALACDAGDAASVANALGRVREELGEVTVYVHNASTFSMGGILELRTEQLEASFHTACMGAFHAVREVVPSMIARRRGTILLTGATASLRGSARFAPVAVGKFALRALGQSLARELGPRGIHVAHVVIDGQIDTPRMRAMMPDRELHTLLSPEAIAETYWQLHVQDPTCWTQELDVRPAVERF